MKKIVIAVLTLGMCMAVGCGNKQSESEEIIGGANEPTTINLESTATGDNENSNDSIIEGMWETASNGWEYDGEIQPQYYVTFADDKINYGHMKDGEFVLEYSDEIDTFSTTDKGGYKVQATASNGTQYTYQSSEETEDILEYYGTWNEDEFGDTYSGSASLVRSSVE